jgi:alpha-tubulin suppressor-like RCC1 family protein
VDEKGSIQCWGDNGAGQSEPPAGHFVGVTGGQLHSCAIREDGRVQCWGSDEDSQSTPP